MKKLMSLVFVGSMLIAGCSQPEEDKKPTAADAKPFVGKPLTPEQAAKLRGNAGGPPSGPMAAGPNNAGSGAPAQAPAGN